VGIQGAKHVVYQSHDGLWLQAWYVPPRNRAVIILLPGVGGARDSMLNEGAILAQHGFGLFLTDLRSCSHPEGQTTLGALEAADLNEAVDWVSAQPRVDHVAVLGYSLGGVTAILGAAVDERIVAVVVEGSFHDLAADITNRGGKNSLWESLLYRAVLFQFRRETGIAAKDISPISVIHRISPRPLLLIYGEREVANTHPREQLARADEPKSLWIVPDRGHGGYISAAPDDWEYRVTAFFNSALLSEGLQN
jgi:dipeptidyl aminopeptidase/acylaminoacyl peptidase